MIFNYVFSLPNATTGLDDIVIQTIAAIPMFTPALLAFVFLVIFLGGIGRQQARLGEADYPMWAVVASIATLIISLILSTVTGFIQLDWLVIVVVITIGSGIWLFLTRDNSGV